MYDKGGHVGSTREPPIGARLSIEVKMVTKLDVLPHSGCEKKSRNRGRLTFRNRHKRKGMGI